MWAQLGSSAPVRWGLVHVSRRKGRVHSPLSGFPEEVDFGEGSVLYWHHDPNGIPWVVIPALTCSAPGDFSVALFPQESEISEHMKELLLSDSAASDPKSFLGLVSLRWGAAEWGEERGLPCGSFAWHHTACKWGR